MVINNLRLSGLATGMDTETIVRDMMRVARMPLDKKIKTRQTLQWKQEDYRNINLRLLTLKNKSFDMRLTSPYRAKTVSSGDQNIVTAAANADAANGTYNIKVKALASAATNMSTAAISASADDKISSGSNILSQAAKFAGAGTFFEGKTVDDTFTVSVRYSATETKDFTFSYGQSLDNIISTINSDKEAGVTLFYDPGSTEDKIVATSKATGEDAVLEITGDFFNTVLGYDNANTTAGTNAEFELNGLQTERSANNFTINGINFSLKGITPGGYAGAATGVTVATDVDAIYNNVKEFIDLYNEVLDLVNSELKEEQFREYQPLTAEEKEAMSEAEIEKWEKKAQSGMLRNDYILSSAASEMRLTMSKIVSGLTGFTSLSDIGITTGSYWDNEGGKLKINEEDLKAAIAADPEGVEALFTNNSEVQAEKGLSRQIYEVVDKAITRVKDQAGSAANLYDQSYLSESIRSIDKNITALEDRMERLETRYWRQFTAMERAISSMNQQSSWLTSQLSGLSAQG